MKDNALEEMVKNTIAETMTIQLGRNEYHGVYVDGVRPAEIEEQYDTNGLHIYQCRASDNDPMGAPVAIAPEGKVIFVNFAGTFITAQPIEKLKDETDITDYSYE